MICCARTILETGVVAPTRQRCPTISRKALGKFGSGRTTVRLPIKHHPNKSPKINPEVIPLDANVAPVSVKNGFKIYLPTTTLTSLVIVLEHPSASQRKYVNLFGIYPFSQHFALVRDSWKFHADP